MMLCVVLLTIDFLFFIFFGGGGCDFGGEAGWMHHLVHRLDLSQCIEPFIFSFREP